MKQLTKTELTDAIFNAVYDIEGKQAADIFLEKETAEVDITRQVLTWLKDCISQFDELQDSQIESASDLCGAASMEICEEQLARAQQVLTALRSLKTHLKSQTKTPLAALSLDHLICQAIARQTKGIQKLKKEIKEIEHYKTSSLKDKKQALKEKLRKKIVEKESALNLLEMQLNEKKEQVRLLASLCSELKVQRSKAKKSK